MNPTTTGQVFIVSAPSGGGKTSLVQHLVKHLDHIEISISHTTRDKRPGEVDGQHYFFIDEAKFQAMLQAGEFVESASVYGYHYGTSVEQIESRLKVGKDVVLDIDWQGAASMRRCFPAAVSVFVLPPSLEVLHHRLNARGRDHPEVISKRMDNAREEIQHYDEFDYLIVNEHFSEAAAALKAIVVTSRVKTGLQVGKYQKLLSLLTA